MLLRNYFHRITQALDARGQYRAPQLAGTYWGGALFVAVFLVVSIVFSGDRRVYYQFLEGHSVTALSAALMAMTSAFAWVCHLSQPRGRREWSKLFWPGFSAGFLFFSLDEILEFHEGLGSWLKSSPLGPTETFRNWNDVVVIAYGLVALFVIAVCLPEILRYPRFAELLGAGFGFFVIHTAIDSLMTGSGKHIPEESSKLMATAFFAAAALTALMTLREQSADGRAAAPPSA